MAEIIIIVARSRNHAIGKNAQMPWHLPRDLRYFKSQTTGHPVIMGRRTYASIGKALPLRRNLIISRNPDFFVADGEVYPSLSTALNQTKTAEKVFIIGGGELYRAALPAADTLLITEVDTEIEDADTFFPPVDKEIWQQCSATFAAKDAANPFDLTFCRYQRK